MRAALALLWLMVCMGPAQAEGASDYERQWPLKVSAGAGLHRLALPAAVLTSSREADLADLRIFNAQGQALSMALVRLPDAPAERRTQHRLMAYPVMAPERPDATAGWTLRIDEAQRRVVQVDAGGQMQAAGQRVVGHLVDTRALEHPVVALNLQGQWPANRFVAVEVSASEDLRAWQSVGSGMLYRTEAEAVDIGATLRMDRVNLRGRYLRLAWPSDQTSPELTAVTLDTVQASEPLTAPLRARLQTQRVGPHELLFTLPFASRLQALEIKPQGQNVLLPITVSGRPSATQPWSRVGSGVVYQIDHQGRPQRHSVIDLPGGRYPELRIEADPRAAGFADDPVVMAHFAPVHLVFLANGTGPFTLSAGRRGDPPVYLPIGTLMPGHRSQDERALPTAEVLPNAADPEMPVIASADGARSQTAWLWAVLLAAVAAMAAMVWLLVRKR
jgi:hypothetical protein